MAGGRYKLYSSQAKVLRVCLALYVRVEKEYESGDGRDRGIHERRRGRMTPQNNFIGFVISKSAPLCLPLCSRIMILRTVRALLTIFLYE